MRRLVMVAAHQLPQSYFVDLAHQVSALSLDQVRDLARRELSATREVTLLVGPREHVIEEYGAAGITQPRFLR